MPKKLIQAMHVQKCQQWPSSQDCAADIASSIRLEVIIQSTSLLQILILASKFTVVLLGGLYIAFACNW
jgi:hypothetical protein